MQVTIRVDLFTCVLCGKWLLLLVDLLAHGLGLLSVVEDEGIEGVGLELGGIRLRVGGGLPFPFFVSCKWLMLRG